MADFFLAQDDETTEEKPAVPPKLEPVEPKTPLATSLRPIRATTTPTLFSVASEKLPKKTPIKKETKKVKVKKEKDEAPSSPSAPTTVALLPPTILSSPPIVNMTLAEDQVQQLVTAVDKLSDKVSKLKTQYKELYANAIDIGQAKGAAAMMERMITTKDELIATLRASQGRS